jgi:hypothetical protein
MNPYLEQEDVWQDFHQSLIPRIREMLNEQVRPDYVVKVEEFLFIHELPEEERRHLGRGDVTVAWSGRTVDATASAGVLEAPTYARVPASEDMERHSYLEIRDRRNRQLITVIELLSPSNKKPGPDREQYLSKRRQIFASGVHLIEIDLLRGGPRLPMEELPECDYYVMVSRSEERPHAGIWPICLRDALPEIPVPLRSPAPDARLDLHDALNRLYDAAGYEDYIYSGYPSPALPPDDDAWARQLIPTSE